MFKLILLLITCLNFGILNAQDEWTNFKLQFNKQYESDEDDNLKFSIWESNMKFINEHNERYEQGLETYTLEINKFGDMTAKQFKNTLDGFDLGLLRNTFSTAGTFSFNSSIQVAEEIDWSDKVTAVKDQGPCGSCYAFSAVAAIESLYALENDALQEFSEQNMLDCTGGSYGNNGCMGGLMDNCFRYVITNGIKLMKYYPYTAKKGPCKQKKTKGLTYKIKGFVSVPANDEEALTRAIEKRPVSVAIDASLNSFRFYKDGVYSDDRCSSTQLNHGVLATGYGHDEESDMDFYLVKNSWGLNWGNNGYLKMSRNNENNCGIATMASFPIGSI